MRSRPRGLIDVDGPIAGFDDHYFDQCTARGWEFDISGPDLQIHRYASDHLVHGSHRKKARRMVEGPGWFEALPVVEGAREGLEDLEGAGIDVFLCTKPLDSSPTCVAEKTAWVERHFPQYLHRLIIAPDKSLIDGDFLLDDAPYETWLDRASWKPIIFTRPYNGPGSVWAHLSHWTWADGTQALLDILG